MYFNRLVDSDQFIFADHEQDPFSDIFSQSSNDNLFKPQTPLNLVDLNQHQIDFFSMERQSLLSQDGIKVGEKS